MNTLNLASDDEPVVKKKSNTRNLKIALGLAAVILIPTIGSTLAGSITLSNSNNIEFAQGTATTQVCNGVTPVSVSPTSSLTTGTFNLNTIVVSGLLEACDAVYFTVRVLNSDNAEQTLFATGPVTFCKVQYDWAGSSTVSDACTITSGDSGSGTFTVSPKTALAATNVAKITLESSSA